MSIAVACSYIIQLTHVRPYLMNYHYRLNKNVLKNKADLSVFRISGETNPKILQREAHAVHSLSVVETKDQKKIGK